MDGQSNLKVKFRSWAWAFSLVLLSGCGPILYVRQVVVRAESAVAAAKTKEAEKHAPYEYYGAEAFLREARIRAGYGDFQIAVRYGKKAEAMAKKAIAITNERIDAQKDVGAGTRPDGPTKVPESSRPEPARPETVRPVEPPSKPLETPRE